MTEKPHEEPEIDNAAAAREARRRRILENSNKRLGKITGREHNEEITPIEPNATNGIYPDPEMERDVYTAPSSVAGITPDEDIFQLLKTMQGANGPQRPQAPPVPETPVSKFIRSKTPVVLLAVIVYALFAAKLEFLVGGFVFSSLIVWEIFEFFYSTFIFKEPPQGGIINVLFAFTGIGQAKAKIILKLLGLTNKILRDIAIFMFTFVMLHLAWSYFVLGEGLSEILDKDFSNLLKEEL